MTVLTLFSILLTSSPLALPESVETLARGADAIAIAQVTTSHSRWTSDGRAIITEIELKVNEGLKGPSAGATVTLLHRGGQVGDVVQQLSGVPSFRVGEEVLVFLERRPADRYRVLWGELATWRIERQSVPQARTESITVPLDSLREHLRARLTPVNSSARIESTSVGFRSVP